MPTLNPRVNVTLSPSLDSLVSQLAKLERVSKSMVLRELLEMAEPSLTQAIALMKAAEGASGKARQSMADDLAKTIKAVESVADLVNQSITSQTRDLVAEAETIKGRRPPRSEGVRVAPPGGVGAGKGKHIGKAKVQAYADTNGLPPAVAAVGAKRPPSSNRGVKC